MAQDSKLGADARKRPPPPNAGKGRPKGTQNKTTRAVKEALNAVYTDLQQEAAKDGGMGENPHLLAWALNNPTEFYKLWVKMLPTEVSGPDGGPIPVSQLTEKFAALSKERREELRAAVAAVIGGQGQ